MTTKPVGLYLHIPFCVRKCNYCDFCSFPVADTRWREEYIKTLAGEISLYKGRGIAVDSIFLGGGTPSLLNACELELLTETIKESFVVLDDIEFTVEVNPGTLTEETAKALASLGVNRISIGLQSIHENELKTLGRIHTFDDFMNSYQLIRRTGFSNVNIDLMYGIPEQTKESFLKTLEVVSDISPEHLSLYGLILEEGTPFYKKRSSLNLPGEDAECDMYFLAADFLHEKGYSHYEISNYAKENYECRHNLKYWRCREYIGFGLSAYSYFGGSRFGNSKHPNEYFAFCGKKYDYAENIDKATEAYEYVMLGLRLKEGISLSDYEKRFNKDFRIGRERILSDLFNTGLMIRSDDRISLTERGFYVSNLILTELI